MIKTVDSSHALHNFESTFLTDLSSVSRENSSASLACVVRVQSFLAGGDEEGEGEGERQEGMCCAKLLLDTCSR